MTDQNVAEAGAPAKSGGNPMAIVGLIITILGLLTFWTGFVGLGLAVLGLILSIVGVKKAGLVGGAGKGAAIAGIVMGILGVLAGGATTACQVACVAAGAQMEAQRQATLNEGAKAAGFENFDAWMAKEPAAAAGFSVQAGLGALGDSGDDTSEEGGAAGTPAKEVEFIGEKCLTLAQKFGSGSKLSDLQKEEQWKNFKGRAFKWKLNVTEVSSDTFGGFTVQYKCAPRSTSFIQDIQIKYAEDRKPVVMEMQKGSVYEVKGVLRMQSALFGMTADDLR